VPVDRVLKVMTASFQVINCQTSNQCSWWRNSVVLADSGTWQTVLASFCATSSLSRLLTDYGPTVPAT